MGRTLKGPGLQWCTRTTIFTSGGSRQPFGSCLQLPPAESTQPEVPRQDGKRLGPRGSGSCGTQHVRRLNLRKAANGSDSRQEGPCGGQAAGASGSGGAQARPRAGSGGAGADRGNLQAGGKWKESSNPTRIAMLSLGKRLERHVSSARKPGLESGSHAGEGC